MNKDFFADYKDFIVCPIQVPTAQDDPFHPQNYSTHYILTLSLYDSLISNWQEATRYEVDVKNSLEKVLEDFNHVQKKIYHLTLLEFEADRSYCVMALSCKNKLDTEEASVCISTILDTMILTPLYVGECWYRLIGSKGRVQRKLFSFSFKEYLLNGGQSNTEVKTSNLIPYPTPHILSMEV